MQIQTPSRTALATTLARAMHVLLDAAPPVLDDRVAFRLLPNYLQRSLRRQAALSRQWLRSPRRYRTSLSAVRSQIVVRARYAEDALVEARASGATRYVILGAGLDTFALRQPEPAVEVLEIDHPATQRWKQQLLRRCGINQPAALSFLPVDFERASLGEVWIDNIAPDFISCLGVSYYLSREVILNTLATLSERTRPGSELVLDYWCERPGLIDAPLLLGTRFAVALQNEPMRSFFEPRDVEQLAVDAGWQVVENCTPAAQNDRYLAHRKDRLAVPSFAHLLRLRR